MRSVPLSDDRTAVSSVVGVILLIAITVVLAGVVHAFAFSVADEKLQAYPTAGFEFDAADCDDEKTGLAATHVAGESIPADELYLEAAGDDPSLSGSWADPDGYSTAGIDDGTVRAGATATVCSKDDTFENGTVRVVWRSGPDDRSVALAEWDGR